jgi:hypothetical protein
LEPVIIGNSFIEQVGNDIRIAIGFTNEMQCLLVAFRWNEEGVIVSLDGKIASIEDVINNFCKYSKKF